MQSLKVEKTDEVQKRDLEVHYLTLQTISGYELSEKKPVVNRAKG